MIKLSFNRRSARLITQWGGVWIIWMKPCTGRGIYIHDFERTVFTGLDCWKQVIPF